MYICSYTYIHHSTCSCFAKVYFVISISIIIVIKKRLGRSPDGHQTSLCHSGHISQHSMQPTKFIIRPTGISQASSQKL